MQQAWTWIEDGRDVRDKGKTSVEKI